MANKKIPQKIWDMMPTVADMKKKKITTKEIAEQLCISVTLVNTLYQRYLNENPPSYRIKQ